MEGLFAEAENIIGPGPTGAGQFLHFSGIDADLVALGLQGRNGVLEMGKIGIGEAAEIDHIGPGPGIVRGLGQDFLHR